MNYIKKDLGIRFINKLLNEEIRDFYTYNKLITKYLGVKTNIPIYINSSIVFLPIKSYKCYDCIWINYYEVKNIYKHDKKIIITFNNKEMEEFSCSYNKYKRIEDSAQKIIEYFNNLNENK